MPKIVNLNDKFKESGTKFNVFPSSSKVSKNYETIYVSVPPPQIRVKEGFGDDKFRVVEKKSISAPSYLCVPIPSVIRPGPNGHFDYLQPSATSKEFACAALYASARRALDMWEHYAGHPIRWFSDYYANYLELIPYGKLFGAFSLYSCVEFGYYHEGAHYCGFIKGSRPNEQGREEEFDLNLPNCENIEVVAHEVGHNILFAELGVPSKEGMTAEYKGFHESVSDVISMLTSLHFDSVVESLLEETKGNLYGNNELSNIMEMPHIGWVRTAFNSYTLPTVYRFEAFPSSPELMQQGGFPPSLIEKITQGRKKGWDPQQILCDTNSEETLWVVGIIGYELSKVLTGTLFDILVEIFQRKLVEFGAISEELDRKSFHDESSAYNTAIKETEHEFEQAYSRNKEKFKTALLEARDELGFLLARAVSKLSPHHLLFFDVANALLEADREKNAGMYRDVIRECFLWRGVKKPYPAASMI